MRGLRLDKRWTKTLTVITIMLLVASTPFIAFVPRTANAATAGRDGKVVTQDQRQAAADRAAAAGYNKGEVSAAATLNPRGVPDYFGVPNYALSPLPTVNATGPSAVPMTTSTVFYFAEGTTRPNFDAYICIQNPGATAANVDITYMKGDATTAFETLTVPPSSRVTTIPRNILGTGDDAAHDFSAKVECTNGQQIVAERPMYFNYMGIWNGGHDVVGASAPAGAFYFAEGTTRPGFDPYICIQNPGAAAADVTITYMKGDATTATENLTVPANARVTTMPRTMLGTGNDAAHDFSASVVCTNGQQIVAERPMYFSYGAGWTGGHDVVGATTTGTAFYFAEGTCRPNFDPYICIQNPSASTANILITYMKGNGTVATELLTIPSNSRVTTMPRNTLGTGEDNAHDFSTKVECTNGQQIVAERPMYFNYMGMWDGGHDVVGSVVTASTFFFAEGTARNNFDAYLCIQNPGANAADVTITYMKGDATTAFETLQVPPNARVTTIPKNILGTADDTAHDFSAKVECTNGQKIVAERPMYFNYGAGWTGGHDVVGMPDSGGAVIPGTTSVVAGTGIRKFMDTLPGLGAANANNLGQYIPVAIPDNTTYGAGTDYYEIEVGEYTEQMHSDLPPTKLRGYRQTNVPGYSQASPPPLNVSPFNYLGPAIVAQKDKPVRIKFTNSLPTGAGGDLFLPVDPTMMGAGMGPNMAMIMSADRVGGAGATVDVMTTMAHSFSVGERVQLQGLTPAAYNGIFKIEAVPAADTFRVTLLSDPGSPATTTMNSMAMALYKENRATLHLHGGFVPWISDGTPHQWTTPAGELTSYPEGVSVSNVPDMDGGVEPQGTLTFYYSNQQSARLMFYHDHSYGITRLNVYAGEAAPYLIQDVLEQDLVNGTNVSTFNPNLYKVIPANEIPLVIQDKTFVPDDAQLAAQDPTWDKATWGGMGSLWYPHVYMPNQNPADPGGINAFGRWHYGPWFWPPTTNINNPPILNPLYDPVNAPWENQYMPATPNPSSVMEGFMDTPVVNGTAYPTVTVQPQAYRFRILNAADDRFFNLQMYLADPSVVTPDGRTNTEVKMVPAVATPGFPDLWPTDGREGGVPDPATAGPQWIQIGNECGFLPEPAVIPNQPIDWNMDQTTFNFGNVSSHSLLLGTAERADVIVDFSAYAGRTIILYNDAPAAFPAIDPRYDYYTGAPDLTATGGSPGTVAGYGPNTRTVMQIKVAAAPNAAPYDVTTLRAAWAKTATNPGVFASGQDQILVPNATYNTAYNGNFAPDTYARIGDTGLSFANLLGNPISIPFSEKAIQDEMGEAFDLDYGRMMGFLGLELPQTGAQNQAFTLYPFASPPVDVTLDNITAGIPNGTANDHTQIWRITHNGVDTHTIHFHLFNVQVINRVAWDNKVMAPDANELGWKETVRVNPLEDIIVALRPYAPTVPFTVPESVRLIDPTHPAGETLPGGPLGFFAPDGSPVTITNDYVNMGWEYVYHCHLLAHEEMDMMHELSFALPRTWPAAASGLTAAVQAGPPASVLLTWTDNSNNETHFIVQKWDTVNLAWTDLANVNRMTPGLPATGTVTYTDTTGAAGDQYRVIATNAVGYRPPVAFTGVTIQFPTVEPDPATMPAPPTATAN